MRDDFLRHLATFPSIKSKKRPKGMNARAAQMAPYSVGSPRQYRMDEKTDMTTQHVSRGLKKDWEIELASTET